MRRMLPPLLVAIAGGMHVLAGGCSSSSALVGSGCDSYCGKVVGARCRNGPDREKCMTRCTDEQTRCRIEQNAFMRCATIEATIACETGTGEPRVLGCQPREAAVADCMACDAFCRKWVESGCANGPTLEECVATCLDPRCSTAHRRVVDCMRTSLVSCGSDHRPEPTPSCALSYAGARTCTARYGQEQPFRWLPPLQYDAGT